MNLFPVKFDQNLLPYDGELHYLENFISSSKSLLLFDQLFNECDWKNDELFIYGKHYTTKRKIAFYADEGLVYNYSKITKNALSWTKTLRDIKTELETLSNCPFNSCLLNLYHDGSEGMSWHSDNEKELGSEPVIASISLGAERKFSWKHRKTKEGQSMILRTGSLLLMKGEMQKHWVHSIPKTKKVLNPRINLSFRNILT